MNPVVEPLTAPNPATTPWVPIGPSQPVGMPSPVVNGQWVKGSGGAAIWSAIQSADLANAFSKSAVNITATNTDLPAPTTAVTNMTVGTGGGTLRSIGAPPITGARYSLTNGASAITLKHNLSGGTGASLILDGAMDRVLNNIGGVELFYDGSLWIESHGLGYPNDQTRALRGDGTWQQTLRLIAPYFNALQQVQFGVQNVSVPQSASTGVVIPLYTAWSTQHMIFLTSIWPQATWSGVACLGVGVPSSLSQGQAQIQNSTQAQTFSCYYMSIGY